MDIIIPTNHRPLRLTSTLSSLLTQIIPQHKRLVLVNNSEPDILINPHIKKLLNAFIKCGWLVETYYSKYKTISLHKKYSLSFIKSDKVVLMDNDLLFTRPDTILELSKALDTYLISCISPLGYELDDDKPVLNNYSYMYNKTEADENGICDGLVALGCFLFFNSNDYYAVADKWCDDLPYMEDQILVHFLKKHKGYAYHKKHIVYHLSYKNDNCYDFNDADVIDYLSKKGDAYKDLLNLRIALKDGAEFEKKIFKK